MPTTFASLPAELRQEILTYAVEPPYLEPPHHPNTLGWMDHYRQMQPNPCATFKRDWNILDQFFDRPDRHPRQVRREFASIHTMLMILVYSRNPAYKDDVEYVVFRKALDPQCLTATLEKWRSCLWNAGFEHRYIFADPWVSPSKKMKRSGRGAFHYYAITYPELLRAYGTGMLRFAKERLQLTIADRVAAQGLVQEIRFNWSNDPLGDINGDKVWIGYYLDPGDSSNMQ